MLERAVVLSEKNILQTSDFILQPETSEQKAKALDELNLEKLEWAAVEQALRVCGGNLTRAAELLGITRFSLYRKLEKWKL